MKALLQRVLKASVAHDGKKNISIDHGLLVFLGLEKDDTLPIGIRLCEKLLSYRVFNDELGRMNQNVQEIGGSIMLVPQFTLAAQTDKGSRPSFSSAMPPKEARELFDGILEEMSSRYQRTISGHFGKHMRVELINDGPVTFLLSLS